VAAPGERLQWAEPIEFLKSFEGIDTFIYK